MIFPHKNVLAFASFPRESYGLKKEFDFFEILFVSVLSVPLVIATDITEKKVRNGLLKSYWFNENYKSIKACRFSVSCTWPE